MKSRKPKKQQCELVTILTSEAVASQLQDFGSYETKIVGTFDDSTLRLFYALVATYNYFKVILFKNLLSPVILTLNRNTKYGGYYLPSGWVNESNIILPEINISPASLEFDPITVMSILVHEMIHHLQHIHGTPGRAGYHNREFAQIMILLGLMPSTTGLPGGKQIGEGMNHYIIKGGRFEKAFLKMPETNRLPFTSFHGLKAIRQSNSNKNKVRYYCPNPNCGINVWGKPNLHLRCDDCNQALIAK